MRTITTRARTGGRLEKEKQRRNLPYPNISLDASRTSRETTPNVKEKEPFQISHHKLKNSKRTQPRPGKRSQGRFIKEKRKE